MSVTISPVRGEIGEIIGASKIVRDITERRQGQEHQQFLLRELAHRSKNQLSVIQAMARQTARNASSLDDFQDRFSKRIQSLAVSTDLLVSHDWSGASLADLVSRQLNGFAVSDTRLVIAGPDVTISSDAAEAIGLALHELATNATKYGAWSTPDGTVIVTWISKGDDTLSLRWREQKGPTVIAPTRSGFGQIVIKQMVAQKVGGAVEMSFDPRWAGMDPVDPRKSISCRCLKDTAW